MKLQRLRPKTGLRTSPWVILGTTVILMAAVLIPAVQNIRRDRSHMNEVLRTKGVALMRAIEAGARSGMMGMPGSGPQIERLVEETGRLPEVLYIAIVGPDGRALAHSDTARIGMPLHPDRPPVHLGPGDEENHHVLTLRDGRRVYEIHRVFKPLGPGWRSRSGMGAMMRRFGMEKGEDQVWNSGAEGSPLIVIGLDIAPYEKAIHADIRNTLLLALLLLLSGLAGFIALFWMNSYRAARRSLRDTSAFADEVVAHLPVALIATDASEQIAFFNSAAAALTAVGREQALGRFPADILPQSLVRLLNSVQHGQAVAEQEMVCSFAGGKALPVSASAAHITAEENHFVGRVLIIKDLGELRRLQAEVRRQEKLAAVGGLAAGIAHEIRNPLSSIKGLATFFAGKFTEGSQERQLAKVMTQEVDRLNRVISELLEFARPTEIKCQPTDLNQLLQHSLQLIAQDAAARQIEVQPHFAKGLCTAWVDPDRISQCLLNLYLNALQAMPNGGRLMVSSEGGAGEVRIHVEDTGKGIAGEDLDRIFDPYFTTKPDGTGLGLAIVHRIIEAHQGSIHVESTPEKSTRFTLAVGCLEERVQEEYHEQTGHPGGR